MKYSLVLCFILTFFLVENSSCEEGKSLLSWKDCLLEFREQNPEIFIAKETLSLAESERSSSYSLFLPSLSLSATHRKDRNDLGLISDQTSMGVNFSQTLFAGFSHRANFKIAGTKYLLSKETYTQELARLSALLKQSYSSLVYAQDLLALTQTIVTRRQENLNLIKLRFESGRENKGSLLLSEANLAQAQYEALQAKHNLELYKGDLAALLGRDDFSSLQVRGDYKVEEKNLETTNLSLLLSQIPDYKKLELSSELADLNVKVERAQFLPSLTLNASWGKQGERWFPKEDSKGVSLNLSWNLFSGFKDKSSYLNALIQKKIQEKENENARRTLYTQINQAKLSFEEAIKKAEVDERFKMASLSRAEIARSKYNNGLMNFEDWDAVETDLIFRQKASLNSKKELIFAESLWQKIQGKGDL